MLSAKETFSALWMQPDSTIRPWRDYRQFAASSRKSAMPLSSFIIGRKLSEPLTGFYLIRRHRFLKLAPNRGDPGFKLLLDFLYTDKTLRHKQVSFDYGTRIHGSSKLDSYALWKFTTFLMSQMTRGIVPASRLPQKAFASICVEACL